jgi:hypothetical protein
MTGTELRDQGMALVNEATPEQWKDEADSLIVSMARSGAEFTAEDVRAWVGNPPKANAMGARFMAALRSGIIERAGWKHASRREAHARALAVYRGVAA